MRLGFSYMIVTKHQQVDVRVLVALVTEELFLADIDELLDEGCARCRSHDAITEAAHGLITENVSECVLFSDLILLVFVGLRQVKDIFYFRVHCACDHV